MGRNRKDWIYELVGERLGYDDLDETPVDRGNRLEEVAIKLFEEKYNKEVDTVGFCVHDDCEYIASSPDGLIMNDGKYTEAVEVKCMSSKNHIKVFCEQSIPKEYHMQVIQYFVVNKDLEKLYFVCYDDRIKELPLIVIERERAQLKSEIEAAEQLQKDVAKEVDRIIEKIAFQ